jgi:GDP-L-fucose synthase
MHVDDLAAALVFLLEHYSDLPHINVGTGVDCSIAEAATVIAKVVGFNGQFVYDTSKPDGTPRKCTDVSRLRALGFMPARDLESGLRETYAWFLENVAVARGMA